MSSSVISTPLRMPLSLITFFPEGVSFLITDNFKILTSFSIVSILWRMSAVLLMAVVFIKFISLLRKSFIKIYHIYRFLSKSGNVPYRYSRKNGNPEVLVTEGVDSCFCRNDKAKERILIY